MQITNSRYIDAEGSIYDVTVTIDGETFDYTVHPADPAPLAVAIRAAMAADPLSIAAYVAPLVTQADLLAHAAKARWQKEAGGIVVDGVPIPTDERTQGVLTAAYASAMADAGFQVPDWKLGPGVYTTLSNAQVIAIANAVRVHVQGCFTTNKQVDQAIAAGSLTTFAAIDAAFAAA